MNGRQYARIMRDNYEDEEAGDFHIISHDNGTVPLPGPQSDKLQALRRDACLASERHDVATLKKVFRSFDADGNGLISRQELSELLLVLHPDSTQSQVDAIFTAADLDKDGFIEYDEFVTWICSDSS